MKIVCDKDMCTGCTACVSVCKKKVVTISKSLSAYNAVIDDSKCINCGLCHSICPQNHDVGLSEPILWKQGWATNPKIRKCGASGGLATAIMESFIQNGGIVCSCTYNEGQFMFSFADNMEDIFKFAGSKYIKSDPRGVFVEIKERLSKGEKILFIGLPCQVAGLKSYIPNHLLSELYTIDLICHGTPSVMLLDKYMIEHKISIAGIRNISFREKHSFKIKYDGIPIAIGRMEDRYTISFLKCLNYTPNCYSCRYASIKRVSDITLGDSWGSDFSKEEQKKGISLAICISDKGKDLLDKSDLCLYDVDEEEAVNSNHQLSKPASNSKRTIFWRYVRKGFTYDTSMFLTYPKLFIKQDVKYILIKFGLLKEN